MICMIWGMCFCCDFVGLVDFGMMFVVVFVIWDGCWLWLCGLDDLDLILVVVWRFAGLVINVGCCVGDLGAL